MHGFECCVHTGTDRQREKGFTLFLQLCSLHAMHDTTFSTNRHVTHHRRVKIDVKST